MPSLIVLVTKENTAHMEGRVQVTQTFGRESIVDDAGCLLARGDSAVVFSTTVEGMREWIRLSGGVWTSKNPMLGSWELKTVG